MFTQRKLIKRVKRMAKFNYKMRFSPYGNSLRAKNYKQAWEALKMTYPEYKDLKKVVQYLSRE